MTPKEKTLCFRNLMETFSKHCRFILTCNYVDKVIDPIKVDVKLFKLYHQLKKILKNLTNLG